MNKSLNSDVPEIPGPNSQIQQNLLNTQRNDFFSPNLTTQKNEESRPRAFTPTRKAATFNHQLNATSSQERIQQANLFQQQERGRRLSMVDRITHQITHLQSRVVRLQRKQARINKTRRIRRPSSQIAKLFPCPMEKCGKNYGTQTALKKHIQLKHPEEKGTEAKVANE